MLKNKTTKTYFEVATKIGYMKEFHASHKNRDELEYRNYLVENLIYIKPSRNFAWANNI